MIQEVDNVSVKEFATGLVLFASVESDCIKKSEGIILYLILRNESKEEITICPGSLAVVLATKCPFKMLPSVIKIPIIGLIGITNIFIVLLRRILNLLKLAVVRFLYLGLIENLLSMDVILG